ncbi:hypothetical protein BDQ17DRAFT_1471311 [Cyathus striatus]|nr:hypothetical protein BDQ17DRAFT_1471311 [Cyathus striatus]
MTTEHPTNRGPSPQHTIDDPAPSSPVPSWILPINPQHHTPLPSAIVSANLKALGALSVETYLSPVSAPLDSYSSAYPIPPTLLIHDAESLPSQSSDGLDDTDTKPNKSATRKLSPVQILHQSCQRAFARSDTMTFEFLEDTPNNGSVRSYKTDPVFARKNDAKLKAAEIAIEMGAVDFIITGHTHPSRGRKDVLLDDLDEMDSDRAAGTQEEKSPIAEIDDCCIEWRAAKVKPHWVMINDARAGNKHGAALRISLTQHAFRVYSVECKHPSPSAAKLACAKTAVDEGVLEYIKHGNGQTSPASATNEPTNAMISSIPPPPSPPITLQSFYETLPQPFPEDVGHKTAPDINAPMWLNTTIQSARGSQLKCTFTSITDDTLGLQGCLLRLERPTETRSYLVDALFCKRADARAAACLIAMSQGVGDYIRNVKSEADSKFPLNRRKFAFEKVIPLINRYALKVRQGNRPEYDFKQEKDGYGCTLKVDISSSSQNSDVREYTVPVEYAHKADAKAAVSCVAVEQGLIELIRFRGGEPPADHIPAWEHLCGNGEGSFGKRKVIEPEVDPEARDAKKRKKGSKSTIEEGQVVDDDTDEASSEMPTSPQRPRRRNRVQSLPTKFAARDYSITCGSPKLKAQQFPGKNAANATPQSPPQPYPLYSNGAPPPQPVLHEPVYGTPHTPVVGPYISGYPPPPAYVYGPFMPGQFYPQPPPAHVHYPPQPSYTTYYPSQPLPSSPFPHYGYPPSPPSPYHPYAHIPSPSQYTHPVPQIIYPPNTLMHPHPAGLHPIPVAYPPGYISPPQLSRSPTWGGLPSPQTPLRLDERSPASSRMLSPMSDTYRPLDPESGSSGSRSPIQYRDYSEERELNVTLNYGEEDTVSTRPTKATSKPKADAQRPPKRKDEKRNGKKRPTPEYVPSSNVAELLAFCFRQNIPQPQFHDEKQGLSKHKVWVVHGAERLELPIAFNSVSEGRERLAKQTLQRLRSRFKLVK